MHKNTWADIVWAGQWPAASDYFKIISYKNIKCPPTPKIVSKIRERGKKSYCIFPKMMIRFSYQNVVILRDTLLKMGDKIRGWETYIALFC